MLPITDAYALPLEEIEWEAVRAQGAGGQNVNKVATTIHLRFNIPASSLPDAWKARLLQLRDHRITDDGVLVIKAQRYRSQERNRADALAQLQELVRRVTVEPKKRRATAPTAASRRQRIEGKKQRGQIKALRGQVRDE